MSESSKTLVKYYDFQALVRLALNDIEYASGVKLKPEDQFHFVQGLDAKGAIFLRLDMSPLKVKRRG